MRFKLDEIFFDLSNIFYIQNETRQHIIQLGRLYYNQRNQSLETKSDLKLKTRLIGCTIWYTK